MFISDERDAPTIILPGEATWEVDAKTVVSFTSVCPKCGRPRHVWCLKFTLVLSAQLYVGNGSLLASSKLQNSCWRLQIKSRKVYSEKELTFHITVSLFLKE